MNKENEEKSNLLDSNPLDQITYIKSFDDKTSLFFRLFGCFFNNKLKNKDFRNLNKLNIDSKIKFDKNNKEHVDLLKELYMIIFNKESKDLFNDENWVKIGFQSNDASIDFRSGGILSLNCLIYFFKNFEPKDMLDFISNNYYFFFAIMSINATFFLKNYLHFGLINSYIKEVHYKDTSNQRALLNFCNFLIEDNYIFYQLNFWYCWCIYKYWQNNYQNKKLDLIKLKEFEELMKKYFKEVIENNTFTNFNSFQDKLKNYILNN